TIVVRGPLSGVRGPPSSLVDRSAVPGLRTVEPEDDAGTSDPGRRTSDDYFLYTRPPFITKLTLRRVEMSVSGLPGTATMSASNPGARVPIVSPRFIDCAESEVAPMIASIGFCPAATRATISRAFWPCA